MLKKSSPTPATLLLVHLTFLCLLLVHPIIVAEADAERNRGIIGKRPSRGASGIFGVRKQSNFHAVSPIGRLSGKFLSSTFGRDYGIGRSWGSRIYSRNGIGNNYFGSQVIPSPSGTGLIESLKRNYQELNSEAQATIQDLPKLTTDGFSGPGFQSF